MTRRLPSLKQLHVFEAAARRQSFKDAADELHVTHAAVSHQIKALEEALGRQLFVRKGRGVTVTDAARAYARTIGEALDRIVAATAEFSEKGMTGQIRLSTPPFYGNRIVLPRLAKFHEAFQDLRIVPDMDSTLVDFRKSDADAALRYGTGPWPGCRALHLHSDELTPVIAPSALRKYSLPLSPATIASMTLGYVDGQEGTWVEWLTAAGYDGPPPGRLIRYGNRARVVDLAFSGHGVALADIRLTAGDVADGNLIRLSDVTIRTDKAMWLVFPETDYPDPRLIAFADWLRDEVEAITPDISGARGVNPPAAAPGA